MEKWGGTPFQEMREHSPRALREVRRQGSGRRFRPAATPRRTPRSGEDERCERLGVSPILLPHKERKEIYLVLYKEGKEKRVLFSQDGEMNAGREISLSYQRDGK